MAVEIGRIGIWSRELRYHTDRAEVREAAAELEELGFETLFIPDAGGDVLDVVEDLLSVTRAVTIATGILNIWMHDPADVAVGVAGIDERHPDRFMMGLGSSHHILVDTDTEKRYGRPVGVMREFLDALDSQPRPPARERRMLAALGPRMLELARDRTAGAHPYLVSPEHTATAREILGPDRLLAPEQSVLLEADPDRALELAREFVADYLRLPNYVNNLRRLGFGDDDLGETPSESLVRALVAFGDEQAVADRIGEHFDAGADHVAIQVIGAGETVPLESWRRLGAALFS